MARGAQSSSVRPSDPQATQDKMTAVPVYLLALVIGESVGQIAFGLLPGMPGLSGLGLIYPGLAPTALLSPAQLGLPLMAPGLGNMKLVGLGSGLPTAGLGAAGSVLPLLGILQPQQLPPQRSRIERSALQSLGSGPQGLAMFGLSNLQKRQAPSLSDPVSGLARLILLGSLLGQTSKISGSGLPVPGLGKGPKLPGLASEGLDSVLPGDSKLPVIVPGLARLQIEDDSELSESDIEQNSKQPVYSSKPPKKIKTNPEFSSVAENQASKENDIESESVGLEEVEPEENQPPSEDEEEPKSNEES